MADEFIEIALTSPPPAALPLGYLDEPDFPSGDPSTDPLFADQDAGMFAQICLNLLATD